MGQPKKQFKVKIIGILEEIDSFIDQKCTYEKVTTNLGRAPPLIWTKSKTTATSFREAILKGGGQQFFQAGKRFELASKDGR